MRYVFYFSLVSCVSVSLITTVFSYAVFFRYKSQLEYFFLLFQTCFLFRVLLDTSIFLTYPLLPANSVLLLLQFLFSRVIISGALVFFILLMHKLTGIFQSAKSRQVVYSLSAFFILYTIIQSVLEFARNTPVSTDPFTFSPGDLVFFILPVYSMLIFFIFSKRIKSAILYRLLRSIYIVMIPLLPVLILDDIFGSAVALFDRISEEAKQFKLFPICYLMIYCLMLYYGFKNFIQERDFIQATHSVHNEFIERFKITEREREVIELMGKGLSNKDIAARLFISTSTVKNHVHNIFEKTGAVNRIGIVRLSSSAEGERG